MEVASFVSMALYSTELGKPVQFYFINKRQTAVVWNLLLFLYGPPDLGASAHFLLYWCKWEQPMVARKRILSLSVLNILILQPPLLQLTADGLVASPRRSIHSSIRGNEYVRRMVIALSNLKCTPNPIFPSYFLANITELAHLNNAGLITASWNIWSVFCLPCSLVLSTAPY